MSIGVCQVGRWGTPPLRSTGPPLIGDLFFFLWSSTKAEQCPNTCRRLKWSGGKRRRVRTSTPAFKTSNDACESRRRRRPSQGAFVAEDEEHLERLEARKTGKLTKTNPKTKSTPACPGKGPSSCVDYRRAGTNSSWPPRSTPTRSATSFATPRSRSILTRSSKGACSTRNASRTWTRGSSSPTSLSTSKSWKSRARQATPLPATANARTTRPTTPDGPPLLGQG